MFWVSLDVAAWDSRYRQARTQDRVANSFCEELKATLLQELADPAAVCISQAQECQQSEIQLWFGVVPLPGTGLAGHALTATAELLLLAAGQEANAHIKCLIWVLGFGFWVVSCWEVQAIDLWSPAIYRVCGSRTTALFLASCKASGFPPYPQLCAPNAEIQRNPHGIGELWLGGRAVVHCWRFAMVENPYLFDLLSVDLPHFPILWGACPCSEEWLLVPV